MNDYLKTRWFGMIAGLFTPIVGSALVMILFEFLGKSGKIPTMGGTLSDNQIRTVYVIGIMLNLIPFQYLKKIKYEKAMSGVVIMTIICIAVWIVYFSKSIFQ